MILNRRDIITLSVWQKAIDLEWVASLPEFVDLQDLHSYWLNKSVPLMATKDISYILTRHILERSEDYSLITCLDQDYPASFGLLEKAPLCLFVKGNKKLLSKKSIGIVGSRKMRHSVVQWCETHLSLFLDQYPVPISSGAAQGVDQLGHRLALRKSIPTIAFLPCGFDKLYPQSFQKIADQIIEEGGCLVSEYPPSFEVRRFSFHQRNRLIASFSSLLLVLQAERKSGSMITANICRNIGKELAVLPGDPNDSCFFGSNDLIAEGAHLLRDRDDLACLFYRALGGRD